MNDDKLRLEQTMHPDGFVDFYALLGVTPSTPSTEIQENINALYQEAQINRDHRVPARRREYQTLLEILPHARLILLDEARSKRYRAYSHAVEMELPRMPYNDFLTALVREKEAVDVRTDILTIRDLSRLRPAATEEAPAPEPNASVPAPAVPSAPETPEVIATPAAPVAPPAPIIAEELPSELANVAPVADVPAPPAMPSASPVAEGQRFSLPSIIGGIVILAGLLIALPSLTGIPMILSAVLAVFAAGICAYVFSLTGEVVEA